MQHQHHYSLLLLHSHHEPSSPSLNALRLRGTEITPACENVVSGKLNMVASGSEDSKAPCGKSRKSCLKRIASHKTRSPKKLARFARPTSLSDCDSECLSRLDRINYRLDRLETLLRYRLARNAILINKLSKGEEMTRGQYRMCAVVDAWQLEWLREGVPSKEKDGMI